MNAFVWRLRQQSLPASKRKAKPADLSITTGRSMCINCGHTLQAIDLVPVLSWLSLGGKCRYCRKKIAWQYPLVELTTALLFLVSYVFWPYKVEGLEAVSFGLWLVLLVGFMALVIYDLRWMLLPNKIVFPMYAIGVLFVLTRTVAATSLQPLLSSLIGVAVGGGIFYVLFQVSRGTWIGGGDVKLGFLLGGLVGGPIPAALMLFGASLLGTIIAVPLLLMGKARRDTRIPFGPFLIGAAIIVQLWGLDLTDWYVSQFIDI